MRELSKRYGLFPCTTGLVLLLGFAVLSLALVRAGEPRARERPLGEIKHGTVAELPLPRDRTDFGIGEKVFFWIEPTVARDADRPAAGRRDVPAGRELADFVVWTASDTSTMLPTITRIGDRTILEVALREHAGELNVGADFLDTTDPIDDRPAEWQPATPPSGAADAPPPQGKGQAQGAGADEPAPWRKKLYRLTELRHARQTPFDEVERQAREILSEPLAAGDQALLYFHLAELYAQSGMIHPERVLEYSRRALALSLEPIQRTTLFIYRGDACLARRTNESYPQRRRAAVVEYLRGLAEIARHDLPAQPPQRKIVTIDDTDEAEAQRDEAGKQRREARAFNARVDFQTTLLQHRNLLRQQLKALDVHGQ